MTSKHQASNPDIIKTFCHSFFNYSQKTLSFKRKVNDSIKQRENIDCRNSIVSCISDLFLKGSLGSSFYESVACKKIEKEEKELRKFKSHE